MPADVDTAAAQREIKVAAVVACLVSQWALHTAHIIASMLQSHGVMQMWNCWSK